MSLFKYLDFETSALCNRACPTCIRNSHPDSAAIMSWFCLNYLDEDLIYDAVEQALAMGFRGGVCLSHYNEPLLDERLPTIARKVRSYSELATVHMNTNGDLINPELAAELDGAFDFIKFTLYEKEPKVSERAFWIETLFIKTEVRISKGQPHMPTHFSPAYDLDALIEVAGHRGCTQPTIRTIINHRRQYLPCCDDVIGNFDLGTFPEVSIAENWFGKQAKIAEALSNAGGRAAYPYCMTCPNGAPWSV